MNMKNTLYLSTALLLLLTGGSAHAESDCPTAKKCLQRGLTCYKKGVATDSCVEDLLKACNLNSGEACARLGSSLIRSTNYVREARMYYEKACSLNHGFACSYLGLMYSEGEGGPQSYSEAKQLMDKGCRLNDAHGCSLLGTMYLDGVGGETDYKKARKYLEKGCRMNQGISCENLGNIYLKGLGVKQNYKHARTYYQKGCSIKWQL